MADIPNIGRTQFNDAMTGKLKSITVSEWLDDNGDPVKIYYQPLTGYEQLEIDSADSAAAKVCQAVKVRARDVNRKLIYFDTALIDLMSNHDFNVLRSIAVLMSADMGEADIETSVEAAEKE